MVTKCSVTAFYIRGLKNSDYLNAPPPCRICTFNWHHLLIQDRTNIASAEQRDREWDWQPKLQSDLHWMVACKLTRYSFKHSMELESGLGYLEDWKQEETSWALSIVRQHTPTCGANQPHWIICYMFVYKLEHEHFISFWGKLRVCYFINMFISLSKTNVVFSSTFDWSFWLQGRCIFIFHLSAYYSTVIAKLPIVRQSNG